MANFDETSGIVPFQTEFGRWWQTIDSVNIEVCAAKFKGGQRITKREVSCCVKTQYIDLKLFGATIIEGDLFGSVVSADTLWTIEDEGRLLKVVMTKTRRSAENCWSALLKNGLYTPDVWTLDQMKQKLTLQRFQAETPGFDFSSATISGNYANGGPTLP